jgi:dienelactone hydrolase
MRAALSVLFVASGIAIAAAQTPASTERAAEHAAGVRFEQPRDHDHEHEDVLIDEMIPIVVSGLHPGATVTIRLVGNKDNAWTSNATFIADNDGRVDLARMAPVKGSYKDIDPMGLFWSAEPMRFPRYADKNIEFAAPERWTLTAEIGDATVAQITIRRGALAAGVKVTPVNVNGLIGMFYEPPEPPRPAAAAGRPTHANANERHPAVLVLGGSGGGIPPASGPAGGLASRGYAVLALAYFGVDGLPSVLSNIPLEYFGTALQWMAAQPSVDPARIGVLGASRGAELALLLGAGYPGIHTVIAYMPSNVVWRGCCDMSTTVAWTVGGRAVARTEIPVEKIQGAVLLISGKDDGVWESAPMAEKIVARLKQNHFTYRVESLTYDHAGHAIGRPYASTMNLSRRHPISGREMHFGGTPSGTAKAREDSWHHLLEFIDHNLRDLPVH